MFLTKYFSSKHRYWYILAVNTNIDPSVIVPPKLKALAVERRFEDVRRFATAINEGLNSQKKQEFIVIKTPCHVQILGTVPSEQIEALFTTESQMYTWTNLFIKGTLDRALVGDTNVEKIRKFLDNPTF